MSKPETDEILNNALLCGQCQFSKKETAIILQTEFTDKIKSFHERGVLEAQLAVRKAMLKKASEGDSAAQKEFAKIALIFEDEEL